MKKNEELILSQSNHDKIAELLEEELGRATVVPDESIYIYIGNLKHINS